MKKENGKLVPETTEEAKDLIKLYRQTANNKLDWSERAGDAATRINLHEAAKDLLDKAEDLVDQWGLGI